jgi:hypothetical protein
VPKQHLCRRNLLAKLNQLLLSSTSQLREKSKMPQLRDRKSTFLLPNQLRLPNLTIHQLDKRHQPLSLSLIIRQLDKLSLTIRQPGKRNPIIRQLGKLSLIIRQPDKRLRLRLQLPNPLRLRLRRLHLRFLNRQGLQMVI